MRNSRSSAEISGNAFADFFYSLSHTSRVLLVGAICLFSLIYFFHSGRATNDLESSATRAIERYLSGTSVLYEGTYSNSASTVELKNDIKAVNVELEPRYFDSLLRGCDYVRICVPNKFFSASVSYEANQDMMTKHYIMKWDAGEYYWTIVEELEP